MANHDARNHVVDVMCKVLRHEQNPMLLNQLGIKFRHYDTYKRPFKEYNVGKMKPIIEDNKYKFCLINWNKNGFEQTKLRDSYTTTKKNEEEGDPGWYTNVSVNYMPGGFNLVNEFMKYGNVVSTHRTPGLSFGYVVLWFVYFFQICCL
jgi:hypothetical protein